MFRELSAALLCQDFYTIKSIANINCLIAVKFMIQGYLHMMLLNLSARVAASRPYSAINLTAGPE